MYSRPATATNSRRRAAKHVPRVSSLARFHKSRVCGNRPRTALAISKNDECYTHAHTPTDKLNNGTLYAPRYEKAFLPKGKKRPQSLRSLGLASLLGEVHETRWPRTCSRPCAFEGKKRNEKTKKIPPHPKHTTKPTSAQRPRPPQDGARRKTSHTLAHTRPLPQIPGLWKSALYSSRNQ